MQGLIGGVSISILQNFPITIPSLEEQKVIAQFLDVKCNEIDELVSLQEKMIEELKTYKQSVITEAVCKGLNPNTPMTDSGIDWIGEMPKHWQLFPIKYVFTHRKEKNNPIKSRERLSLSIGTGITLYSEKTTNLDRFKDDFTQYQLTYPNDIVLNCMNMIVGAVGRSEYFGCVSPVYYVIYPSNNDNSYYYGYLLNTPSIRGVYHSLGQGIYAIERGDGRVNTCRLKVSYEDFGRIEIPVPPVSEQQEIADFLDKKCNEIDQLIAIKQKKIEALKDYKKSLI
jgi:type I restriction enzyme S subunit